MPRGASGFGRWPEIGLAVEGWPDLVAHFEREYGPAHPATTGGDEGRPAAGVIISRLEHGPSEPSAAIVRGRHKTTSWAMRLSDPDEGAIRLELDLRGLFGRSLVQSLIVEPLLAVAAARAGRALVPAAGLVRPDGSVWLLAGRSRTGKSTVALRAWGRGSGILADDRVLLDGSGAVAGFRRRLRVYPDIAVTAPAAHARLGARDRRSLRLSDVVRRATAGWVALPVLVPWRTVLEPPSGRILAGVLVVERDPAAHEASSTSDGERVLGTLADIVRADLGSIAAHDEAWRAEAGRASTLTMDIVRRGISAAAAEVGILVVPDGWPADRAVAAIERRLGLASGGGRTAGPGTER